MSNDTRRPHAEMMTIAESLIALLRPHCEWIEVGGSLRRGKDMVGDVEIIAIPKPSYLAFTDKLLHDGVIGKFLYSNDLHRWGDTYRGIAFKGVKCEVYLCNDWNRGYIQWLRTGPGDGNTLVVTRMKYRNAPFHVHDGHVWQGSDKLYINTEQQWFNLLGIPHLAPAERTEERYGKLFAQGHQWGAIPHQCVIYSAAASKDPDAYPLEGSPLSPPHDLHRYVDVLRERYKSSPESFHDILKRKRLVLVSDREAALIAAVDVLTKIAKAAGVTVIRGGELIVKPEQLSMF